MTLSWKNAPSYFRYWGKARPDTLSLGAPCHLLPFHSLDVAAVGYWLLDPKTKRCQELARQLGMEPEQLQGLFVFALVLHDLGKFGRPFQSLATPTLSELVKADASLPYNTASYPHHSAAGAVFLEAFLDGELKGHGIEAWGWHSAHPKSRAFLRLWLGVAFGHHGQPVDAAGLTNPSPGYREDRQAAWEFTCDVANWLAPGWPEERVADKDWMRRLNHLSWHFAGLAVLSDWLGSDQNTFVYQSVPESLHDYWQHKALPRAKQLVMALGLENSWEVAPFEGVESFFGFSPSPLQQWAQDLVCEASPQLFILEDVTGAGKTEAAMALTHRILERGLAQGVYFGLPTMATSNAMYGRVADVYRRWFKGGRNPSLVLAHGARQLNPVFAQSLVPEQPEDHGYGIGEHTASASCNRWFADSKKKALLAGVGVGTVDQALMSVLPFKHQSLRLIGLANKVLVVDEVHACDDYMAGLLEAVLEAHGRHGGSAILLTATLPQSMRSQLIQAYQRGRNLPVDHVLAEPAFPLATYVSDAGVACYPLQTRPDVVRRVSVKTLDSVNVAAQFVLRQAEAGQCVCWIRNTVDDAIAVYRALVEQAQDPTKVLLFHSRYVMADRQAIEEKALQLFGKHSTAAQRAGWILVSTQVVEQSLDLDFDQMVTDLAPIDLLIQRAGRLHRHCRDEMGTPIQGSDQRPGPVLHVLAPPFVRDPDPAWVSSSLPGTGAVYRDHGRLWLTLSVLLEESAICMPERARHLIESVFGEVAQSAIPEGLQRRHIEQEGERSGRRGMANFNRLKLEKGYSIQASHGWSEDLSIGTRLSDEPSVTVTMVKWDHDRKQLLPWVSEGAFVWELSQLQIRESLARKLSPLPEAFRAAQEQLIASRPNLAYSRLWCPEVGEMAYSPLLGLHKPVSDDAVDKDLGC